MASEIPDYWTLLGIWIRREDGLPELCTAMLNGERDVPLMDEGTIVFFRRPGDAEEMIDRFGPVTDAERRGLEAVSVYCEIAALLEVVRTGRTDEYAVVVDTLNAVLDLIAATGVGMPDDIRHTLHTAADYMTFSRDIAAWFDETKISREHLVQSIRWAVGTIVTHSKIVEAAASG